MNVLLIEDSPDYAELVQLWLSGRGEASAFVLNWTDSLAAGLNRLAQGGVDVVLLDLGLPDSDGIGTFLATRAHAPGIPVIILSAAESESLALQVVQEGAEDYVVKSTCTAELLVKTLRFSVIRRKLQVKQVSTGAPLGRARVIGLVGAKGGVGTTTLACTLAAALRHETGEEVLLADLDANSGLVSFLMALNPKYSVVDAIGNLDRLDRTCWNGIVTHGVDDLQVIASPGMLCSGDMPAESLRQVLTLIRPFYQWIVIDFGRLNTTCQSLAGEVDEVLVVTTPLLPALHEAKRVIDALVDRGLERDRLRLIVNQTKAFRSLAGRELQQIFGIHVYATLPHDSQELHQACLQRKLPAATGNVGGQVVNLARRLAGLGEKKGKKNPPAFLSFVERFRKGPAQGCEAMDSQC